MLEYVARKGLGCFRQRQVPAFKVHVVLEASSWQAVRHMKFNGLGKQGMLRLLLERVGGGGRKVRGMCVEGG